MEEFIGNINTVWGVVALLIFSAYKIIDHIIATSRKKKEEHLLSLNFKELSDKLDDHIEMDNKFGRDITVRVKRIELLNMMSQYPSRELRIDGMYRDYQSAGGNSYIDDVYCEWKSSISKDKIKGRKSKNQ